MEFAPVTFLFTDIEGSTRLWEQHPESMSAALARHDALSREAVVRHRGTVVKTSGDGVHAAFADPLDALHSAIEIQRSLAGVPGPVSLRVRSAVHLGLAERREGDYYGAAVNRAARLADAAHAGQVLASEAVHGAVMGRLPEPLNLRSLGAMRLRDLSAAEPVFQLVHPELREDFPPLRSLATSPNNLPHLLTGLVGRRTEVREVRSLLERTRLVTVAGVGGIGKTRLALQAAAHLLDQHPDGVWLVELSAIADPEWLDSTLAQVLGVKEERGRTVREAVVRRLRAERTLIVLDTCEHLLDACAGLADALLKAAPHLRILATSRATLDIDGEAAFHVPALAIPDPDFPSGLQLLREIDSVRLLLERAALRAPDFRVAEADAPALARVAYRLDGIPLAIELAASQLRVQSLADLERGLADRFGLLAGGSRVAAPRHKTLQALIDWSWELLDPPAQQLYARLSVFAGGWTRDAAAAVCIDGAGKGIDEGLETLRRSSLAVEDARSGGTRMRFLDTVREHAATRLTESGEEDRVRETHARWAQALAASHPEGLRQPGPRHAQLEADFDNLRAALRWMLRSDAAPEPAMHLLANLWWFFHYGRHGREAASLCRQATGHAMARDQTRERAMALRIEGQLRYSLGELEESLRLAIRARDMMAALGWTEELGMAHIAVAFPTYVKHGFAAAREPYLRGIQALEASGHPESAAHQLGNFAMTCLYGGERALGWESLSRIEALSGRLPPGSHVHGVFQDCRGSFLLAEGRLGEALAAFEAALQHAERRGDHWRRCYSIAHLAHAQVLSGDLSRSRQLLVEVIGTLAEGGNALELVNAVETVALHLAHDGRGGEAHALLAATLAYRNQRDFPIGGQARWMIDAVLAKAGPAVPGFKGPTGEVTLEALARLALAGLR